MKRSVGVLGLVVGLLLVGCGADDSAGTATDGAADASAGEVAKTTTPAGFVASTGDPVYVDLILDCVYGENEAGSCETLESGGLAAGDAYGLGNAYVQAPDAPLREDCIGGDAISCAELDARVERTATEGAADARLLCMFYSAVTAGVATDVDFAHLQTLLGADAPPGILEAMTTLAADFGDSGALDSLGGYVGPICTEFGD